MNSKELFEIIQKSWSNCSDEMNYMYDLLKKLKNKKLSGFDSLYESIKESHCKIASSLLEFKMLNFIEKEKKDGRRNKKGV
jgi:hypothetical protein